MEWNMDNNTEHLQKVSNESNKCVKPCIACQPIESHNCIANSHINCNCTDYSGCAELGSDPDNLADKINCIGNPYPKVQHYELAPRIIVGAII
jgi:hypothetical protein